MSILGQIIDEVVKENIEVKKEQELSRLYDVIDIEKEFELLQYQDIKDAIIVNNEGKLFVAGERALVRVSKNGSIYFVLKDRVVRGALRNALLEKFINDRTNKQWNKSEPTDLPSFLVYHWVGSNSKEFYVWFNKRTNRISSIYIGEYGKKRLQEEMKTITYSKLKEESIVGSKNILIKDKDEVYGIQEPEDFIIRTNELEELLQTILDMKNRKLSVEELELLKEIKSEIDYII